MNQDTKSYAPITSACAGISLEAAGIIDEVLRSIKWDPKGARAAARRLVTLLTRRVEPDLGYARGGLAPWQKRKVERYLKDNLDRPIRVEELAKLVSLSTGHFCRVYKGAFGWTPHAHIIQLRVELSQRLMLSTEEPLSQIALACGMADQSHLSKHFQRGVGESPSAWRRRRVSRGPTEPIDAVVTVRRAA